MDFFTHMKKNKFTRESLILIILVWVLLSTLMGLATTNYYNLYYQNQLDSSKYIIEPYLRDFEEVLTNIKLFVQESDVVTQSEYRNFCNGICTDSDAVQFVAYAPLGIVSYVNPENMEDTYLGTDILERFSQTELSKFQYAMEHDEMFVSYETNNQIELYQTITEDGSFVGIVYMMLDATVISAELTDVLSESELVLYTEDNVFILGDNAVELDDYNVYEIDLSGVTFFAGVNYYTSYQNQVILVISIIQIGILLSLGTIFLLVYRNQKRINEFVNQIDYTYHHDLETSLRNKISLYEDFEQLKEDNSTLYIAYGVFNNIKYINYKYGHEMGSNVVSAAISLIQGVIREHTHMYHLGGDEYAFIFVVDSSNEVKNIINRVLRVFDRDIVIKRVRTNISLSLGVVQYPSEGKNVDELIRNAHLTLSQSRIINSNNYAFFSSTAVTDMISNQDFDEYVSKLDLDLFKLYLMPVVDCKTNKIVGFECLSRPFNEFDELMNTELVVTSLERNGRIQELDELVFKKMIRYMEDIMNLYPDNELFLSVNASALSFNENYVDKIIKEFEQSKVQPGNIVLELTESYKVEDHDYLIKLFRRLNTAGIRTAIDDFGSGYSSLSYISKFPIYSIKVDKMYVKDYALNDFNRTLFLTLRSIAEVLNCKLVAEGVDDPDTLDFLRENGCEWYQGFLFSKGVPFEKAVEMLQIAENTKKV